MELVIFGAGLVGVAVGIAVVGDAVEGVVVTAALCLNEASAARRQLSNAASASTSAGDRSLVPDMAGGSVPTIGAELSGEAT